MFYEPPKRHIERVDRVDNAWYSVKSAPVDDPGRTNMDHVTESLHEIVNLVHKESNKVAKVYIAGFSQGAFMALLIGLIARG